MSYFITTAWILQWGALSPNTLCHVLPVFLFFSVCRRTLCSVLAEQKDAEDYWQRSALFSSSGRACFLQGKEVSFPKRQTSQGFWTCRRNRERVPLSLSYNRVWTRSWKKILQSNQENREHQKFFWNATVLQEKSQSGMRKLNRKQER